MSNDNRLKLEQDLSTFHSLVAETEDFAEFSLSTLNYFISITAASQGNLYLRENESLELKLVSSSHQSSFDAMPNTQVGEIVFFGDQVLLPFLYQKTEIGAIIVKGADRKRIVEKHFEITEACLLAGLKFNSLILVETLARKMRVINEHLLTYQTSSEGKITGISTALTKQLGYEPEEIIGKSMEQLFPEAVQSDPENEDKICAFKTQEGETVWIKSSEIPTFNFLGEFTGNLYLQEDITDYKRIKEMSIRDDMTGLYNRRYFNQVFAQCIDQAHRYDIHNGFALLDVDNFKKYNDTYGHQEGDQVLKSVASTLQKCFKRKGDYVFRIGGEEFGILCTVTEEKDVEILVNIAREAIASLEIPHTGNPAKKVTISAGVITFSKSTLLDENELYKMADVALYEAKSNGRNQVRIAGNTNDIELF